MTKTELDKILEEHKKWLRSEGGRRANLSGADLSGAYLRGTYLDPTSKPNGDAAGFAMDGDLCIGYRTPNSILINPSHIYEPGKTYEAPYFSTADTGCHPGLYVRPVRDAGDIEVRFLAADCHHAGDKWRVKKFTVKETA